MGLYAWALCEADKCPRLESRRAVLFYVDVCARLSVTLSKQQARGHVCRVPVERLGERREEEGEREIFSRGVA